MRGKSLGAASFPHSVELHNVLRYEHPDSIRVDKKTALQVRNWNKSNKCINNTESKY
jgi:hypothetical protein